MKSTICTLFEGDYHYGVGALTNSLYYHGFRGVIWVGYRGNLPPWAKPLKEYEKYSEYLVADGCFLRFIKLETDYHLTNYKPNFMLSLWKEYCPEAESMFYFDPDIVIKCRWSYYEEWASYGIALCEDVNSPILDNHPLRMAWRKYYEHYGFEFNRHIDSYVNGGFIGITKEKKEFLQTWLKIQELMALEIGGLQKATIAVKAKIEPDPCFIFKRNDQDALNICLMNSNFTISIIGKEGMDFAYGGFTMSHAIGQNKPWQKVYLKEAILKNKINFADRQYWNYTQIVIYLYTRKYLFFKKIDLIISQIILKIFY
jgi:hypothetical protein